MTVKSVSKLSALLVAAIGLIYSGVDEISNDGDYLAGIIYFVFAVVFIALYIIAREKK